MCTLRIHTERCVNKHRLLPAIMSAWTRYSSYSDLSVNSLVNLSSFLWLRLSKNLSKMYQKKKRTPKNIGCLDKLYILNKIKHRWLKILMDPWDHSSKNQYLLGKTHVEMLKSIFSWMTYFWEWTWLFSCGKDKQWKSEDKGYYF